MVDVAQTRERGWVVIEFNAMGTTGRYVNNRVDRIISDLYGAPATMAQSDYEAFQRRIDDGEVAALNMT